MLVPRATPADLLTYTSELPVFVSVNWNPAPFTDSGLPATDVIVPFVATVFVTLSPVSENVRLFDVAVFPPDAVRALKFESIPETPYTVSLVDRPALIVVDAEKNWKLDEADTSAVTVRSVQVS